MTIREQMRSAYLRSNLTVVDIAAASGVSERTIRNILRGQNVSAENLFAVACVLNVRAIDVPHASA